MTETRIPESELRRFAPLAAPLLAGTAAGSFGPRAAKNRPGPGLEYLDTRQYQHGDDMRMIDWRQSARSQALLIRRYRDEAAADWHLCVDCSASVNWGEHKWPATVRLATALAYTLLYAGHRVALILFSDRIEGMCELGRGARHFASLLNMLLGEITTVGGAFLPRFVAAGMPLPQGKMPLPHSRTNLGICLPLVKQNSNVFVLSDFLEPDGMRSDLRALRARTASVDALQVLDEYEVALPANDPVALVDVESGRRQNVADAELAAQIARQRLQSHQDVLASNCAGLGVRFSTSLAHDRWQRVVLGHL